MPVVKWEFHDHVTDTTIELELNPQEVEMGGINKKITEKPTSSPTGQTIMFEGLSEPQVISISGVTLTEAQYKVFESWAQKNYQFRMTDDLSRVYWVYITAFNPSRRTNGYYPWLADYSISFTVLDWST